MVNQNAAGLTNSWKISYLHDQNVGAESNMWLQCTLDSNSKLSRVECASYYPLPNSTDRNTPFGA